MPSPSSSILFLNSVPPSLFTAKPSKTDIKPTQTHPTRSNLGNNRHVSSSPSKFACGSASRSSSAWISDFDLYELLGVESSSNQAEIKKAYRALQKRCHPDIAGPAGHDMAIILNEVYSLLSDPNSRSAYDQEQSKVSEFKGYTGKPLYSTWFGSENEQRAVFVDEIKCVGCLKCALHANQTFAIESVYGRARVIAQWADPEDKIVDAIQTCPVDCIFMVERSDLAALEFLMSKQPRGSVSMTGGNCGGLRVSNIFADVNKFQNRFHEMKDRSSGKESKESDFQRNSRISAVRGIRSIYEWWYWQSPTPRNSETGTNMRLIHIPASTGPRTDKIREAAAKLKSRENAAPRNHHPYKPNEEYWTPMLTLPSVSSSSNSSESPPRSVQSKDSKNINSAAAAAAAAAAVEKEKRKWNPMSLRIPLLMSAVSSVVVGNRYGEIPGNNLINEHIGGTVALEVVNSFELQVVLAATTWFLIGFSIVGAFEALGGKGVFRR
ncbi:uncharacterized protein M6B38_323170 [Iris pallida]|uniref:J domain-containing protein n=1 Tax=Iris pallida TaxID=29817 RepID=A0AAX6HA03_IRIPA|nr:uncharacterized protein M6B38_323165 [Iris pallida]KAJ6837836.1 uncharacterized protein M6B38_323170 [Iris pallida]